MTRIQWLEKEFKEKLSQHFDFDNLDAVNSDNIIQHIASFDPSHNYKFTAWVIRRLLSQDFLLEDLYKVENDLTLFIQHRFQLDAKQRDINCFRSFQELRDRVKAFEINEVSGKEIKRQEKVRAYQESVILVDDDIWTLAIPLSEAASQWWGKNTRWCTAARKNSVFDYYFSKGPLIVFVFKKENEKFQLFFNSGVNFSAMKTKNSMSSEVCQFMNASDDPVSKYYLQRYRSYFEPIVTTALNWDSTALRLMPEYLKTEEIYFLHLNIRPDIIVDVPKKFQSKELWLKALDVQPNIILFMPSEFFSADLLKYTSELSPLKCFELKTRYDKDAELRCNFGNISGNEFALEMTKFNSKIIRFLPKQYIEDLDRETLIKFGRADAIDRSSMSLNEWITAVRANQNLLHDLPEQFKIYEVYLSAVEGSSWALQFVPEHMRDLKLCEKAVQKSIFTMQFVPENIRSLLPEYMEKFKKVRKLEKREVCSDEIPQKGNVRNNTVIPDWIKHSTILSELTALFAPSSPN